MRRRGNAVGREGAPRPTPQHHAARLQRRHARYQRLQGAESATTALPRAGYHQGKRLHRHRNENTLNNISAGLDSYQHLQDAEGI